MEGGGLLIEAEAVSGVTTIDAPPTVGPVALLRATWKLPYGYLGDACANHSGPSVVWVGPALWTSRLSEPCSHGLKWKSIRCGARGSGYLEGVCRLRAKTRQDGLGPPTLLVTAVQ